jgi:hypothetical protein
VTQRAEDGRRRRFPGEARLEHRVESPVGKTRCVSVPRCGNRVPDADDLLALVVPGVEKELRVLGDHAPEQPLQDGPFVHERGKVRIRSLKALRVRGLAGPLGTRRKMERHVKAEPRTPDWILSPAELCSACSGNIPAHSGTAALRTICAWGQGYAQVDASAGQFDTAFAVTQCMSGVATARIAERNLAVRSLCMRTGPSSCLR